MFILYKVSLKYGHLKFNKNVTKLIKFFRASSSTQLFRGAIVNYRTHDVLQRHPFPFIS
jgi:hypothetical protein